MKSYLNSKCCLSKNSYGKSVITTEHINKGEVIAIWGGSILTQSEVDSLPKALQHYPLCVHPGFYSRPAGTPHPLWVGMKAGLTPKFVV
jgi:hypothetical protein